MKAPGTLHQSFRERSKHMIIIPSSVPSVVNPICAICDYLLQLYHLLYLSHLLSLVRLSWKNHTICGNCNHLWHVLTNDLFLKSDVASVTICSTC